MAEATPPHLHPQQLARLESLLKAGFQFVTFEQFARYPAVEKQSFVALLDLADDRVRLYGSVGYHIGNGIGMLIAHSGGSAFVWKAEKVEATQDLLITYEAIKKELVELLNEGHPE